MLLVKVLPENAVSVSYYFDSDALHFLRCVVRDNKPIYLNRDGDMLELIADRMKTQEERLKPILEGIHYHIDAVQDYFRSGRIETVSQNSDISSVAIASAHLPISCV